MSTMNRMSAKNFLKTMDKYEALVKMVERAVQPSNPSLVKGLQKNKEKLDDAFLDMVHDWKTFKRDLNISDEVFNGLDTDGSAAYEHNDAWMSSMEEAYYVLEEKADNKLNEINSAKETPQGHDGNKLETDSRASQAQERRLKDSMANQILLCSDSITSSVGKIHAEVAGMIDGQESAVRVQSLLSLLNTLDEKIDNTYNSLVNQYMGYLDETEINEKEALRSAFTKTEKARISSLLIALPKKIKDSSAAQAASSPCASSFGLKEQTYLKKTEPPVWEGDPILFADFKRKWLSQVTPARLPAESELDRLRENIPQQAAKALFGEKEMSKAWKILENLYGDKDLIANKLKLQLKTIKVQAKHDYDVVIELVTDINNIVLRLKAIDMEQVLHTDCEFLSAVFRALPSKFQDKWLDYDKGLYSSKWAALMSFLEVSRDQALQTKVMFCSFEQSKNEREYTCRKCGTMGHIAKNCTSKKVLTASVNTSQVSDDKKKELQRQRDICGKCPLCKKYHTYFKAKDKEYWPSDRLFKCDQFLGLSLHDKAQTLERLGSCARCTSWNHSKSACPATTKCSKFINGVKCNGEHSHLVCGSNNPYCGSVSISLSSVSASLVSSFSEEESFPDLTAETLLLFEDIKIDGASGTAFTCWDKGSTRCLITHDYARAHGLQSQEVFFKLDVVGTEGNTQKGLYYTFDLVRNDGSKRKVWAYGINVIMKPPDPVDVSAVRKVFPHVPDQVFAARMKKSVDILMGNNFLGLHPDGGLGRDSVNDLKVYQSQFGLGWVLAGTHPAIKSSNIHLSSAAVHLARVFKCEVVPHNLPGFWDAECLGVLPPKRCGRCLRCQECSDSGLLRSRRDQEELEMLEKSVELKDGSLHVKYPFVRDPYCLPNNRATVLRMAEGLERRLLKSGHLEKYNAEFRKQVDRGAVTELTQEELANWKGPTNYISHHGVITDSVTTPLRIVTNSSLKNGKWSLNECLVRGPNSLNPMLNIALRFRCHEVGMVFDLTKAYNSLITGPVERHLRRFIWRFSPNETWREFAFDRVAFGDLPSANLLEIGRNLTADVGRDIDPTAARKIKFDSYVDDNVSGGSREEVDRMKGVRLSDGSYSGTMRQILDKGNLRMKVIVSSGEIDEEVKHLIGNKVLGYEWNATTDYMAVKFRVFPCNKKRKVSPLPALIPEDLLKLKDLVLTKRICLGITNGFFDFLGISCPFILRFKLLMRELFEHHCKTLDWGDEVSVKFADSMKSLIAEAVMSDSLCFPRSVRPENAVDAPLVVEFSDGALPAFSATVYLRWRIQCQHKSLDCTDCHELFSARLLWAKARVTPVNGYSVPRSELSAKVLGSRMALTTVRALHSEPSMAPKCVIMLADSKCTISAVDTTSRALKPFFSNRVSEILENMGEMEKLCDVEKIQYVPGALNPADLATRGSVKVSDLGPDSFWQLGPSFLCLRRELWPISRDFIGNSVPEEELRGKEVFLSCLRATAMSMKVDSSAKLPQVDVTFLQESASKSTSRFFKSLQAGRRHVSSAKLPQLWFTVQEVIEYSNNICKVIRILGYLLCMWKLSATNELPTKDNIRDLSPDVIDTAEKLLQLSAMPASFTALESGSLLSLNPERCGSLIVTRGRLGEQSLSRLLGVPYLPIIMPSTRAAYLYMVRAHEGEGNMVHNSVVITLARSREKVWIVRARDLAKKVVSRCPKCRRNNKRLVSQQMGIVKEESLTVCRPFTHIAIDFAGPIKVKGAVNTRAKIKCWIIVYCCRSTKAVELLPTCGYDTESFLLKHQEFVYRRGAPATIVSDRGTQLVSAGRLLAEKDTPKEWDWSKITQDNIASNWRFVPIGSPHYNGLPEATVKVLKRTLQLALGPGVELKYPELVTLLTKIAYTVNSRPLGLQNVSQASNQEDVMHPLTPNMLLLGRSSNFSPSMEFSGDERFCTRLAYVSQVEKEWWDRWIRSVLPTLFCYRKWKLKQKNLEVGELVMLRYPGNFKDDYCVAKITAVHPGEDDLVREVTVSYKKKDSREPVEVYKSKPLISEKVSVHRLHRLHLVDEGLCESSKQVNMTEDGDEIK